VSIYTAVMEGMGYRYNGPQAEPHGSAAATGSTAYAVGWKQGQQVRVPMPSPALPNYGAAMERADRWRGVVSPLGGTAEYPWSQAPKVGDAALKQEFRRSR
jgi:hypothetical protein